MNKLERFEQGPMTASSADFLAQTYGNGSTIDEFASSLPENARIIDVGAGLSGFGAAVATRRADIRWTNLDYNYKPGVAQSELLNEARWAAPNNLDFVRGDILDLSPEQSGRYDRAYSYNVLTHLMRIDRKLGRQALSGLVTLLNVEGELMVGPTNSKMATDERWKATTLPAGATTEEIESTQKLLTSPRITNIYYNASQASGVGIYPAKRFGPATRGKVVLSDDGGQSQYEVFSKRGLLLGSRLAAGLFHS